MKKTVENVTTLYVVFMTVVVSFALSIAQSLDSNLEKKDLFIFIVGFWGSMICLIVHYGVLYFKAIKQEDKDMKTFLLICLVIDSMIYLVGFVRMVLESKLSMEHYVYGYYNGFQYFMLIMILVLRLSNVLFRL